MFSWVCSRCGHEVPPSKTVCPFCTPPAPEPVAAPPFAAQPPLQQYQPAQPYAPVPAQQPPPQQPPPQQQYGQQAPPQYWQPQGPPPPQQYPPPQYAQQAPPQYWQPQQQYPPQQYPLPQEQAPQQYQPPPPPPQQYVAPPPPPPPPPPPVQYAPPAPVAEYKAEPTPWPPPEEQDGKPAWLKAALAFAGVLALLGVVYYLTSSHGSSAAKDAAKQQTTNPLQKYIEVVGIRSVGDKSGEAVRFLVVNHEGTEVTDQTANVTLWASTQRSEEDSVGTFTFHVDSLGPDDSKELSAPLKTEKGPTDMPEDWRNVTADVQVTSTQ